MLENLTDMLSNKLEDEGLDSILAVLIALNDEEFNVMAPLILEELEKAANNPSDRNLIQAEIKKSGKTTKELLELQKEAVKEIEKYSDELSEEKVDFLRRVVAIITNIYTRLDSGQETITIPIQTTSEDIILPKYAHITDGAMDIYATETVTISPGETKIVKTGIKVAIPNGYAILIQPRSGLSAKTKLRISNTPGLIDSGYRDEIGVIIENIEPPIKDIQYDFLENGKVDIKSIEHGSAYTVEKGERIAQMRLVQIPIINWLQIKNVEEIEGDRGGGFGSSGRF